MNVSLPGVISRNLYSYYLYSMQKQLLFTGNPFDEEYYLSQFENSYGFNVILPEWPEMLTEKDLSWNTVKHEIEYHYKNYLNNLNSAKE